MPTLPFDHGCAAIHECCQLIKRTSRRFAAESPCCFAKCACTGWSRLHQNLFPDCLRGFMNLSCVKREDLNNRVQFAIE